ncbi:Membrane bound L-sorbosone dehydrogenase [Anatilimnocola aggregata]|uniref:Membrane bound L-sorbosone dehydrogenase n=1 Tax=Anatilimnocola aggregata TaxID=2528021 RepID=A0A517Y4Q5_9BACT|nr:PVC-type heme-binding CxxCH protein [Anatilimnocola aggregata]QDU25228.1 Membrane bound L-sorbosone dehydrogenase [Anatilimnocola aggregata]
MNLRSWLGGLLVLGCACAVLAEDFIPRRQDKLPGPALTPAEAIKKMTVLPGFTVELVASEPDIVNPVAMTFDERGRAWITESFEYPRREPGPGRDRVKVIEDTDGDGKADKFTVFAEGLNIPSGVAVGHGGVWVANAPDILFLQDTDGDGKADKQEVIVTGFGRDDTHELPNSLTWGPDGYLYGLNGVFNYCHVKYPKTSKHYREDQPGWKFTCALFRIHPITKQFEVFCEGTSNPWGVAFDGEGSAFISACVIDHLWHLTRTGYYHRQGGPYPPHTWKLESIVKHKHQAAAYCGIHYFDSDAYPAEYRNKLYMGNIHGGCINVDKLRRDGSSYFATGEADFLTANDVWFMPVVQKTGPDGCLYVLDWYDRYHCYQDANRDPKGIDRANGRLYRVRYKDTPRAAAVDFAKLSDDELIKLLHKENDYARSTAQRVLTERIASWEAPVRPTGKQQTYRLKDGSTRVLEFPTFADGEVPEVVSPLELELQQLALNDKAPRKARMHALWTTLSLKQPNEAYSLRLLSDKDPALRAWAVRTVGNFGGSEAAWKQVRLLATDASVDVQLQVAITAATKNDEHTIPTLLNVLENCGDDMLIPHIVWQNLHPLLEKQGEQFVKLLEQPNLASSKNVMALMPRITDRVLSSKDVRTEVLAAMLKTVMMKKSDQTAATALLQTLSQRIQSRELEGKKLDSVKAVLSDRVDEIIQTPGSPLYMDAILVAGTWKNEKAISELLEFATKVKADEVRREQAINVLAAAQEPRLLDIAGTILRQPDLNSLKIRSAMMAALGKLESPEVAHETIKRYDVLGEELQPRAIELLTQRASWGKTLLGAVAEKKIAATAINVNQAQKLMSLGDKELSELVTKHWGVVRTGRDPARVKIIEEMRAHLNKTPGDPTRGLAVFNKVCGQCHKMHGNGQEVGPDITVNGRSNFEQLLSNVFDPSLVIGASYQARTVLTADGRVLTGLLAEDNEQRVVLKVQGGKLETIARGDIEEMKISELSLMPEQLEKQLKPEEIADLFSLLALDKPPSDPNAKLIPGAPVKKQ